MSELPDPRILPSDSVPQASMGRNLVALGQDRSKVSLGLSVAGLLIGLSAALQSASVVPEGVWWALALLATGTAFSVPWSTAGRALRLTTRSLPFGSVAEPLDADATLPTLTGPVITAQWVDLARMAAWRDWWAQAAWRARVWSRMAMVCGIALLLAWVLAPLSVLRYGLGAIAVVVLARAAAPLLSGRQAFFARGRALVTGSPRAVVLIASLLILGVWQHWISQPSVATVASNLSPGSATPLATSGSPNSKPAAGNATMESTIPPSNSSDPLVKAAAQTPSTSATGTAWMGLPTSIDLNLLVVLGVLSVLAARHVGVARLTAQVRERLLPLAQAPGGIAFGIIMVLLAFSIWHRPMAGVVPQQTFTTGEREVLRATIAQKTNELKQLTQQLPPGDAHAAWDAESGASTQLLELSRVEKELADARYRLATLNSAGKTYGTTRSDDSIDLTYWGHPSSAGGSSASSIDGSASTGLGGAGAVPPPRSP
jgi:hypothetical protein